jgi:apolipoprotein N-acyltransferase
VIDVGAVRLGMLICYEVAFDDRVTDAVSAGATVLAVPSNNATYVGTTQPAQQLAITRFRALETARATLLASTTGVSAIIDSSGTVLTSIQDGAAGSRIGDVAPSTQITTAVRWGGAIGVALAVISAVSVIIGTLAHRRAARRPEAAFAATTWMQ